MKFLASILNFFKRTFFKNNWFLFLDIGSKNVKTVILKIDNKLCHGYVFGYGFAEIFSASSGKFLKNKKKLGAEEFFSNKEELLMLAIKKAIFNASKMANRDAYSTIVSFSGNALGARRDIIRHVRHRSGLRINSHEFKNLMQMAKWQIKDIVEKRKEAPALPDSRSVLWYNIQDIKIDNFRVTNPVGFRGKEIYMDIFSSFIKSNALDMFYRIAKKIKINVIATLFLPYTIADVILSLKNIDSALIFNIGALNTDVVLVSDGVISFIDSIPFGGENFNYRLSKELLVDRKSAEKIKLKYSSGLLSDNVSVNFKDFFKIESRLFSNSLEYLLKESWKISNLPQKIFLMGQSAALPVIQEIIENYFKDFSSKGNICFERFSLEDITNIKDLTGTIDERAFLPILCSASAYLNQYPAFKGNISEADFHRRAAI